MQVFDSDGIFTKEFGSYGNAEGEFDCLAGVAVNRIGQFIIADRYNHRIQVSRKQEDKDPAFYFKRETFTEKSKYRKKKYYFELKKHQSVVRVRADPYLPIQQTLPLFGAVLS